MKKKALENIIQLSQECLAHFWRMDVEYVIQYFAKDIFWIGSAQDQFTEGYEETVKDFRNIMEEIKPCHLSQQEFYVAQNVKNACTIVGRYLTTTNDDVGYFLQVQQRCTFVWELVKGVPILKHCHISNPMGELKLAEGEKFVNAIGEMTKKYWETRFSDTGETKRILVTDTQDVIHFLLPSEVLYVTANRRNSVIYTTTGEAIQARMSITDFLKAAGEGFSSVHRSHVLNNVYISSIQKYKVIMTDGKSIPIPEKRYKEIREKLIKIQSIETDEG